MYKIYLEGGAIWMEKKNNAGAVASNAGDDFHLIWACKKILKILEPNSQLTAVSVEGPS